jgi:hypothetical protein
MELLPLPFPRVEGSTVPDYNVDRGERLPLDADSAALLVDEYEGERDEEGR